MDMPQQIERAILAMLPLLDGETLNRVATEVQALIAARQAEANSEANAQEENYTNTVTEPLLPAYLGKLGSETGW